MNRLAAAALASVLSSLTASAQDADWDGLLDSVETNTGVYVGSGNTGTDPSHPDSDGDGFGDGYEVEQGTSPINGSSTPSVAYRVQRVLDPRGTALAMGDTKFVEVGEQFVAAWNPSGNGVVHVLSLAENGDLTKLHSVTAPQASYDYGSFGQRMAIMGNQLLVGNPYTIVSATHDGRAYDYSLSPTGLATLTQTLGNNPATATYIGWTVRLSSKFRIVDSPGNNSYGSTSRVYVLGQPSYSGGALLKTLNHSGEGINHLVISEDESILTRLIDRLNTGVLLQYSLADGDSSTTAIRELSMTVVQSGGNGHPDLNRNGQGHHRIDVFGSTVYMADGDQLRLLRADGGSFAHEAYSLLPLSDGAAWNSFNVMRVGRRLVVSSPFVSVAAGSTGAMGIFRIEDDGSLTFQETLAFPDSLTGGSFGSQFDFRESTGQIVVTNETGAVKKNVYTSNDGMLLVLAPRQAPRLTSLTASLFEPAPGATFQIGATLDSGLEVTYQWYRDGALIPAENGGSSPTIALQADSFSEGLWTLVATNPDGQESLSIRVAVFSDTDGDGLSDYRETNLTFSNPELADTDGDSLPDGQEVLEIGTSPLLIDSDGDGYRDDYERSGGWNPTDPNSFPSQLSAIRTSVELSVEARLGYQYRWQYSNDLETWTDTEIEFEGTGRRIDIHRSLRGGKPMFWRVIESAVAP